MPASTRFQSAEARCAAASGILARLRGGNDAGFVFHPYPVTPVSRRLPAPSRQGRGRGCRRSASQPAAALPVGAKGALAETIVRARLGAVAQAADVVLEAVPVDDLISAASVQFSGWMGPPWVKEGWFHAYRLLAPGLDAKDRPAAEEAYERLTHGELRGGLAERVDLERSLVAALGRGCTRVVVGYALREEYFNEAYPPGVENIAYDAHRRPQRAGFHPHGEAQGVPLERQAAPRRPPRLATRPGTLSAASPTPRRG